MPSSHFINLFDSISELKRIYLDEGIASAPPSSDQQEQARAFVVFAHAEFEYFVEESLRSLADIVFDRAKSGAYGRSSISLIAFGGIDAQSGGTVLIPNKKSPRKLASRFGEAHQKLVQTINENHGIRESHLAEMTIPLGLDGTMFDNTWINDLEAFCAMRGAFAHSSRTTQRANYLAVNPSDIWSKCDRLLTTNAATSVNNLISSFESFDAWIEGEKLTFGAVATVAVPVSTFLEKVRSVFRG